MNRTARPPLLRWLCLSSSLGSLLFGAASCAAPARAAGKEAKVSDPVTLECSVSAAGGVLRVSYTVHNRSAERVFVLDQMVRAGEGGYLKTPGDMIVRQEAPGTVALVRGFVDPGHPVQHQYAPGARAVDPGKSLSGTAELPLPLRAQHPYGRPVPLSGTPKSAVVEIGYLGGAPASLSFVSYPLQGGGALTAPALPTVASRQRFARCAPLALPSP